MMARYNHLKIYKDSFACFIDYNRIFPNLSKKHKYSLGVQIQNLLLENFRLIIKINRFEIITKKMDLIEELIVNCEQILILFRSLSFLKEISKNYYLDISSKLLEIIKQAEGWFKYNKNLLLSRGGGQKDLICLLSNFSIPEFI